MYHRILSNSASECGAIELKNKVPQRASDAGWCPEGVRMLVNDLPGVSACFGVEVDASQSKDRVCILEPFG